MVSLLSWVPQRLTFASELRTSSTLFESRRFGADLKRLAAFCIALFVAASKAAFAAAIAAGFAGTGEARHGWSMEMKARIAHRTGLVSETMMW